MFGFLNIDKPKGMTSHDVVSRLRKILKIKQIGHSGTLDPMATGVLPIAVGKATRLIEYLSDDKKYLVTAKLGVISDSYDSDGNVEKFSDDVVELSDIEKYIPNFIGDIKQRPPVFSAVHYKGKRLYELARAGEKIENIPEREVYIESIDIKKFDFDNQVFELEITCGKGTYIRSIVHDLGQLLGVGAIMTDLVRLCSSQFPIDSSLTLNELATRDYLVENLLNPVDILEFKKITLTEDQFNKVKHGNSIGYGKVLDNKYALLLYNNNLVSVGVVDGEFINPSKVLV